MKKIIFSCLLFAINSTFCIAQSYLNWVQDFDTLSNRESSVKYADSAFYFTFSSGSEFATPSDPLPNIKGQIYAKKNTELAKIFEKKKEHFRFYSNYPNNLTIQNKSIYHTFSYDSIGTIDTVLHYITGSLMCKMKTDGESALCNRITDSVYNTNLLGNLILKNKNIVHFGYKRFRTAIKIEDLYLLLTDTNLTILDTAQYGIGLNTYHI